MLVLSRKIGEGILIGRDIELVVLKKKGRHVLLAITAPPSVVIRRGELQEVSPRPLTPELNRLALRATASKHGIKI